MEAEISQQLWPTIWVVLILVALAALGWVAVLMPVTAMAALGSFMGAVAGMFIAVSRPDSAPADIPGGLAVGAAVGLVIGLVAGAVLFGRPGSRGHDLMGRWFLLSGILGGGVVVWTMGVCWSGSCAWPRYWLGLALFLGVTLAYATGLALRSRHPTLGLILVLGVDGFALGMFVSSLIIQDSWGVEAGAVIGASVGIVNGALVGWRQAGPSSDASLRAPAQPGTPAGAA